MKKIIIGILIGTTITLIGIKVYNSIHTINCEYCGELFNNTNTMEKNTCDICYGWKEYKERNDLK